jgi:hypothetical protein
MVKGPLRLPINFKVKCFGSGRNVNGIGKYVSLYPKSCSAKLEVVSEMQLEESVSRPAPRDVLASDATVESMEKVDEGLTSRLGIAPCHNDGRGGKGLRFQ